VVASRWRRGAAAPRPTRAQRCAPIIPFIAGQWSLRGGDAARQRHAPRGRSRAAPRSFPSLRGSGRFAVATRRGSATPHAGAALRPDHSLHCGAVVASLNARLAVRRGGKVSISFIAGQWSLRGGNPPVKMELQCFNPLHCGAVVASEGISGAGARPRARLNPLHCGAVVASNADVEVSVARLDVLIPFIAGQWSLLLALLERIGGIGMS